MIRLAAPIVLAELGWAAMGLVDTMVVGRVSSEAMAAVGLGAVVFYGVGILRERPATWASIRWCRKPSARATVRIATAPWSTVCGWHSCSSLSSWA